MSTAESVAAISKLCDSAGVSVTIAETNTLASELGKDPLLIGLFGTILHGDTNLDIKSASEDVLNKFIKATLKETSAAGRSLLLDMVVEKRKRFSGFDSFQPEIDFAKFHCHRIDVHAIDAAADYIAQGVLILFR